MALVDRSGDNPTIPENLEKIKNNNSIFGKIKIALYVILFLVIFFFFATVFYVQSHTIYIDNPTGTGITFKIGDNPEERLEAYSHITYTISPGKYDLIVDGENIGSFEKKYLDGNSFLNPTQDIYIQEYILYGDENYYNELPINHIEAYGNEAEGPFLVHSGIYIKGDWDFDVDEEIPMEVSLKRGKDYAIKSKIYRFDEFAQMYNETYAGQSTDDEYVEENITGENLDETGEISGTGQLN